MILSRGTMPSGRADAAEIYGLHKNVHPAKNDTFFPSPYSRPECDSAPRGPEPWIRPAGARSLVRAPIFRGAFGRLPPETSHTMP
ncbi:hypothetical protein VZT92_012296 [Zoarces viviparus]|uniref:Uncharacterized protein n=1 Tax=Zoarces viviparus TaxID=48416 RepID=A0AAW1F8H7_ZOAVI